MDSSAIEIAQLQDAIKHAVDSAQLRPIIISLNGDNSWLWSYPCPACEREQTGKAYFHIVFEPWLAGPTGLLGNLGPWLIHIALGQASTITTAEGVDDLVRHIETCWAGCNDHVYVPTEKPCVDAILLGFHYTDHIHPPTLRMFDKRIPVVVTPQGKGIVESLQHFDNISLIPDVDPDAPTRRDSHPNGLPEWLLPIRMPGHHELNYLFALIWTQTLPDGREEHEAIYQSPHGARIDQKPLQAFLRTVPLPQPLALFHGLKENHAYGMMNTYGAAGGLPLWRMLGEPKYWVLSHDSHLQYAGVVLRTLWVHDTPRTIEWALGRESLKVKEDARTVPRVVRIGSGQAFVL